MEDEFEDASFFGPEPATDELRARPAVIHHEI
jgi:hypothetical protein